MTRYIVPLITTYYEYSSVEAENEDEAVEIVRDGGGDPIEDWMDFRETIAIGHDAGEVVEDER